MIFKAGLFTPRPTETFLRTRLTALLRDTHLHPPDPHALLEAVVPLLPPGPSTFLDPYLLQIASALSSHFIAHPAAPADLAALTAALHHCASRLGLNAVRARSRTALDSRKASAPLVDFLLAESRASDRARLVLAALEACLARGAGDKNARVLVPVAAAWAVLRAAAGAHTAPPDALALPHASTVLAHLAATDSDTPAARAAVEQLCAHADDAALPATPDALGRQLDAVRHRGKVGTLDALWCAFRAQLDGTQSPGPLMDRKWEAAAKFLFVFRALAAGRGAVMDRAVVSDADRAQAAERAADVLAMTPRPRPPPVVHALLASFWTKDDVVDAEKDRRAAVRAIWADADKDARAYAMYMDALAHTGGHDEIPAVWDELVGDDKCRLEHANEKGIDPKNMAWPSTEMLNDTLSRLFRSPSRQPPAPPSLAHAAGLALYARAIDPGTSLRADVVTINTVLRHVQHLPPNSGLTAQDVIAAAACLGLTPDIVTYTTLVQAHLRAGDAAGAQRVLDAMRARGVEPNERIAGVLVAELARAGTRDGLRQAEDVVRDARARGLRLSEHAWTSLVAGYFAGGWHAEGWQAFKRMQSAGAPPSIVTYNVVLRAAGGRAGAAVEAGAHADPRREERSLQLRLVRDAVQRRLRLDEDTYAIALGALCRARAWADAKEIVHIMKSQAFMPRAPSLVKLVRQAEGAR
ncbi:hypothetical protein Q5752_005016 [Cryptotrichosporon argae]